MVSTRAKRIALLLVLGVFLTGSLFATTLVVGADRTVADSAFMTDAAEEEDVYDMLIEEFTDEMVADLEDEELEQLNTPVDELVDNALEEGDLEAQMNENIEELYAYLHDERDDFEVAIETVAIKDSLEVDVEADLRDESFITEEMPEVGDTDVSSMTESEADYEETRAEFREENPIPPGFEEQAEQEALDELQATLEEDVDDETQREAMFAYGEVYVEALIYEEVSYETFSENEERERHAFAATMASEFRSELDAELEDDHVIADDEDEDLVAALDTIQTTVSAISTLSLVLPVVSIGLAGAIVLVAGSRSGALFQVGAISAVVGGATYGGARVAEEVAVDEIQAEMADDPAIADLFTAMLSQLLSVFTSQSFVLIGLGVGLVGGAVVIRMGLAPIADVPGGSSSGRPTGTATSGSASVDEPAPDADGEVLEYDETERDEAEPERDEPEPKAVTDEAESASTTDDKDQATEDNQSPTDETDDEKPLEATPGDGVDSPEDATDGAADDTTDAGEKSDRD